MSEVLGNETMGMAMDVMENEGVKPSTVIVDSGNNISYAKVGLAAGIGTLAVAAVTTAVATTVATLVVKHRLKKAGISADVHMKDIFENAEEAFEDAFEGEEV